MLARHHDRKFFRHEVRLAFAADAGGVDEAEAASVVLDDFVDRVAGGAGDGRDDGAVGGGEAVQQRGLADVGVADDGDFGFVGFGVGWSSVVVGASVLQWDLGRLRRLRLRGRDACSTACPVRFHRRENFDDCVEQIVDAAAVFGGDGKHLLDAQAVEVVDQGRLLFGVHLVDGEEEGAVGFAQQAGEFEVGAGEFGASVDDHDDGGGFVEGDAGLAENFRGDQFFVFGNYAAGVDDAEVAAFAIRRRRRGDRG